MEFLDHTRFGGWSVIIPPNPTATQTEHSSVHLTAQFLASERGVDVLYAPVDGVGRVDPQDIVNLIRERPAGDRGLVSLMLVNNEIGTIQDIASIVIVVCRLNTPRGFICDPQGAAWFPGRRPHGRRSGPRCGSGRARRLSQVHSPGHVELDLQALGVDFLSLGAHKFHGPVGVGLLYCRG